MTKNKMRIGALLMVMLIMSMALVPAVSAQTEISMEQWMQDHTVNVKSTTIYKYGQGTLEIKEIYTGKDLENKFGIKNRTKIRKIPAEARTVGMKEGDEKVLVTEKTVVLTSENDPYPWMVTYDYPQWTWSLQNSVYEQEDPINLAWGTISIDRAKSEMLGAGWIDDPSEYTYYVYDPTNGWMADDGVADDKYRILGGYHARLWQMSDGDVVANAHHDSSIPHKADQYEQAEQLVAGFYSTWTVYENIYNLNNYVSYPYNNGLATQIYDL